MYRKILVAYGTSAASLRALARALALGELLGAEEVRALSLAPLPASADGLLFATAAARTAREVLAWRASVEQRHQREQKDFLRGLEQSLRGGSFRADLRGGSLGVEAVGQYAEDNGFDLVALGKDDEGAAAALAARGPMDVLVVPAPRAGRPDHPDQCRTYRRILAGEVGDSRAVRRAISLARAGRAQVAVTDLSRLHLDGTAADNLPPAAWCEWSDGPNGDEPLGEPHVPASSRTASFVGRLVASDDIDLVVLARPPGRGIMDRVFGSPIARICQRAACDVLVIGRRGAMARSSL